MVKQIHLSQNKIALVDDDDYDQINQYKWCAAKMGNTYYALRKNIDDGRQIFMHRFIMQIKEDIDHRDNNGLNNQKYNLRPSNHRTNGHNRKKQQVSTLSSFKGVTYNNKWRARIRVEGKLIHLGYFEDEKKAALAYDAAAIVHFGEFANLNFPKGIQK